MPGRALTRLLPARQEEDQLSDSDRPAGTASDGPSYRKSSFSGSGNCVEVKQAPETEAVLVRDSKNRLQRSLKFSTTEWHSFVRRVQAGEFDVT